MSNHKLRTVSVASVCVLSCALVSACRNGGQSTTLPRGILSFTQGSVDSQLERIRGMSLSPSVCGSSNGQFPADTSIPYEWAPIAPSGNYRYPTVDEHQFIAGGAMTKWEPSATATDPLGVRGDIMFAHPFGSDYSWDLALNPASYLALNYVRPGQGNNIPLHVEIERGLFPYQDFGWGQPKYADSVLVKGDWIMDCGHPDSPHSEIHPPSFLAFGRAINADTTVALAFASLYRTTQLYNPDASVAYDLTNYRRFNDPDTKPFPAHLTDEVTKVYALKSNRLEAHVLVEPTDFESVAWNVCAPSHRPVDATMEYSYHFTARTGVAIQTFPDQTNGCLEVVAIQTPNFVPAPLAKPNYVPWSWADIEAAASENTNPPKPAHVKQKIYDRICSNAGLCGPGIRYVGIERDPLIDSYPTQSPLAAAGADSPSAVSSADDQPFPFYGRVRVSWKVGAPPQTSLAADPSQLTWVNGPTTQKTVSITNQGGSGSTTYQLGSVTIAGDAVADYRLTADSCSGATLPPKATCQITVVFVPKAIGSRDAAVIVMDSAGVRRLTVPLTGPGLIQ
jgi:hypothetical protein